MTLWSVGLFTKHQVPLLCAQLAHPEQPDATGKHHYDKLPQHKSYQNTALSKAKSVSSFSFSTLSWGKLLIVKLPSLMWWLSSGMLAAGHQCKQEKNEVRAQLELVEMLVECGTCLLEAEQVQVHYPIHQKRPQAGLGWHSLQQATGALLVDCPLSLDPVHAKEVNPRHQSHQSRQ